MLCCTLCGLLACDESCGNSELPQCRAQRCSFLFNSNFAVACRVGDAAATVCFILVMSSSSEVIEDCGSMAGSEMQFPLSLARCERECARGGSVFSCVGIRFVKLSILLTTELDLCRSNLCSVNPFSFERRRYE
eukprot:scpid65025/ scgid12367/ 